VIKIKHAQMKNTTILLGKNIKCIYQSFPKSTKVKEHSPECEDLLTRRYHACTLSLGANTEENSRARRSQNYLPSRLNLPVRQPRKNPSRAYCSFRTAKQISTQNTVPTPCELPVVTHAHPTHTPFRQFDARRNAGLREFRALET